MKIKWKEYVRRAKNADIKLKKTIKNLKGLKDDTKVCYQREKIKIES